MSVNTLLKTGMEQSLDSTDTSGLLLKNFSKELNCENLFQQNISL